MQEYNNDPRTVLTLDAGGTNFVFSAIKGCREVITPITIPANADNLELSLKGMIEGFHKAKELLNEEPVAISFAFPGPADYPKGIIGDLGNLPAYRGGVAMGTMLEKEFNLPIFVNNDGNLYALGEAANGFLPFVNECLSKNGSSKRFKNIVGFTLGTGFGGGIVTDGRLFLGDNSDSTELWTMSNHTKPDENIESLISIKAVVNSYKSITNTTQEITPKDVFEIATGKKEGDKEAALKCYEKMGRALGDALANMLTIVDGVAVIGGGISAAAELFSAAMMEEIRSKYSNGNPRLAQNAYFIDDQNEMELFVKDKSSKITVPFSDEVIEYENHKRVAIGLSKIGTAKAISIGAYIFALSKLDSK